MHLKVHDVKMRPGGYKVANCHVVGDKGELSSISRVEIEYIPTENTERLLRIGTTFDCQLTVKEVPDGDKAKKVTDRVGFKGQKKIGIQKKSNR